MKKFLVEEIETGMRFDVFLVKKLNLSKNKCQSLISSGEALINDQKQKKSYLLKNNDEIKVEIITKNVVNELDPIPLDLDIIYEDDGLAVINKPVNLVVHPSSSYKGITLVNGLLYQIPVLKKIQGTRPGIVHRLDKDTTGLMIVGKTEETIIQMQALLQKRHVKRTYWALIHGFLGQHGTIDLPIGRDMKNHLKMSVTSKGKASVTHFKTLQRFEHYSLLELELETGRTHQIRVHLSYLKHSIVGDNLYGNHNENIKTQLLHAKKLDFSHPQKEKKISLEVPLNNAFQKVLDQLELEPSSFL
ncbi:MAG: pseudouridylate synthase [Candidatus Phytoplasma pruni]|uniref:RluA family pseudouridine synthase n=1 Tax=Poinsettia branch-inducing phytoplasma TaxID=138647 RepID=UPI000371AE41|nr:RluA family pseudouridine synthase [Poinsettia branch-inducing phytoplasma]WEK82476.1 MAG: pseudouridylate synthase [Candidatus Phytoplasma pruni]